MISSEEYIQSRMVYWNTRDSSSKFLRIYQELLRQPKTQDNKWEKRCHQVIIAKDLAVYAQAIAPRVHVGISFESVRINRHKKISLTHQNAIVPPNQISPSLFSAIYPLEVGGKLWDCHKRPAHQLQLSAIATMILYADSQKFFCPKVVIGPSKKIYNETFYIERLYLIFNVGTIRRWCAKLFSLCKIEINANIKLALRLTKSYNFSEDPKIENFTSYLVRHGLSEDHANKISDSVASIVVDLAISYRFGQLKQLLSNQKESATETRTILHKIEQFQHLSHIRRFPQEHELCEIEMIFCELYLKEKKS